MQNKWYRKYIKCTLRIVVQQYEKKNVLPSITSRKKTSFFRIANKMIEMSEILRENITKVNIWNSFLKHLSTHANTYLLLGT